MISILKLFSSNFFPRIPFSLWMFPCFALFIFYFFFKIEFEINGRMVIEIF